MTVQFKEVSTVEIGSLTTVELYALTHEILNEWRVRERYNPNNKRWNG